MTKTLTIKSYPTLVSQLRKVFIEGLQKIEAEKVRTYWRTGQLISNFLLANKQRADYGDGLYNRLEDDLDIERTVLLRTVQFYRAFPIVAARRQLTWSHYRQLITVEDKSKRDLFTQRAVQKEWSYRELEEAIRLDKLKIVEPRQKPAQRSAVKLPVTRARLFTYKIVEPDYIHPIDERLVVDLGFNFLTHAKISGIRLKAGEIIESVKRGSGYSFQHSDAKPKDLHTYKALVERVVDGDTIWLNIDLGFDCWIREKIRLRGIDTPEIATVKGQQAKKFVESRLKQVKFVIAKTYKSDKYERYLTDIFYQSNEENLETVLEQGIFLNQELLDEGLAVSM
ncbi:DUF1016 N-terminal domain-containing protein [Candidatus Omnitrophota bacterium]